ncbi:MAG: Gfo/Idh/MocA family oxidoreductase [Clostridiales bacterium]|nr:Gfo/Idh/MocA family oxidoreductase [Clostridiales bacterium]
MKKRLGFGIVGCGVISDWHAAAINEIDCTVLVGVTDVNEHKRVETAKKYNARPFDTYEQMLENNEIDIISICTPSGTHAPLAIEAAKAGKHVIVEKPMALNLAESDQIIKACEENKVKLTVISQLRFSDAVAKVKDAVDSGLLGKLILGNAYLKYHRSQEYYDSSAWRGTWAMDGGGALMNQGIHGIDLLQYIMGDVKSVFAYTKTLARKIEVEDSAVAVLEFTNDALGTIQGTTSIYPGFPRELEFNGDKGSIVLREDCIVKWEIEGQEVPEGLIADERELVYQSQSNPTGFGIDGHIKQIRQMAESIWDDTKPLVDQYEGRKPIEIIMAIYESSRTGKKVFLR